MFSLHERTQRRVCRTAFVLVCAVPTVLTIGWVLYFHRPWHERDWRRSLESALHVRVEVDGISAPRPQKRLIQRVRLGDLRSDRHFVEIEGLDITTRAIFAQSVTLRCRQLETLAQTVRVWLAEENFCATNLQIKHLVLAGDKEAIFELHNVSCETTLEPDGRGRLFVQGQANGRTVQFIIDRSKDSKTRCSLDAKEAVLPAWLLADALPGANCGDKATFTGVLKFEEQNASTAMEFSGLIDDIDMQTWLGTSHLRATAKLRIDKLVCKDGLVETIQGSLVAEKGQISNALMLSLKDKLYCPLPGELATGLGHDFHAFSKIGCRFQLNADGLTVSGSFPIENGQWAIILADDKPLALQPAYSRLPLAYLVEVVSAPSDYKVPATREAIRLSEKLPLPDAATQKK